MPVAATWSSEAEHRLGLVRSSRRLHAKVFKPREPIGRDGYTLVVFCGAKQEPVDVAIVVRSVVEAIGTVG